MIPRRTLDEAGRHVGRCIFSVSGRTYKLTLDQDDPAWAEGRIALEVTAKSWRGDDTASSELVCYGLTYTNRPTPSLRAVAHTTRFAAWSGR